MEIIAKERDLTKQENIIKNLIASDDKRYADAFHLVYNYYRLDYLMGKSNYFLVLKAVYAENVNLSKWKLAQHCKVSRTSLFDYRHDIIKCFYISLNEIIIKEDIAVTKG